MLDIISLVYFTVSNLYLLGKFPLDIYDFIDLKAGYAISDYGVLFETSTYFRVSAIITGLLCGLDAITYPLYKKVNKKIYNIHALTAFGILGIGFIPTIDIYPDKALHWVFALTFILIYPLARIFILKKFNKNLARKLLISYLALNILAILVYLGVQGQSPAYPEYLMWINVLGTIIISKSFLAKINKKSEVPEVKKIGSDQRDQ